MGALIKCNAKSVNIFLVVKYGEAIAQYQHKKKAPTLLQVLHRWQLVQDQTIFKSRSGVKLSISRRFCSLDMPV
jgi:hypothetical protein